MPHDLTASDVEVILNQDGIDRFSGRGIVARPTVIFGDGANTYPALGIPMPPIPRFGPTFQIDGVLIEQPFSPYLFHFDRANHKIRILLKVTGGASGFTELGHVAVPKTTLYLFVMGR